VTTHIREYPKSSYISHRNTRKYSVYNDRDLITNFAEHTRTLPSFYE